MNSIKKIQSELGKEYSCVDITKKFLKTIEDKKDINAFITIRAEALEEAKSIDKKLKEGEKLTGVMGVPMAIKDNILIKGTRCTAASKILDNYIAPYSANVIDKLEGAIILGKTNMDEFAHGSSGEHSAYGATKNPNNTEYVPGGSSSGSAASVAGDMAVCALGSDTAGSVRQPASFCGVVGLKPTYGAVSRYGLMSMVCSLDQIGPLTNSVEDAEIVFNTIKGKDERDSTSLDYEVEDDKKEFVVGIPEELINNIDTDVKGIFDDSIKKLEEKGVKFKSIKMPHFKYGISCYYIITPAEISSNLSRYDGVKFGMSSRSGDILSNYLETRGQYFGEEVKRRIMIGTHVLSSGYYDAYYLRAQKVRTKIVEDFNNAFEDVDLIFTPTAPSLPFKFGDMMDPLSMYMSDLLTVPASLAGVPAISLPAGRVGDLPVGMQFIAPVLKEKRLFNIGKLFEQC